MNTSRLIQAAQNMIARHEGLRLKPYQCTAGKLTIGYGRNLEDNGISEEEARLLLTADTQAAYNQLLEHPWFDELNDTRKLVLIDMCFNLGFPRLMKFKKMLTALLNHDYTEAANQMLDSRWAVQVGGRADRLAGIMREGHL